MSDYVFAMRDPISGLNAALEAEAREELAMPRPLRVWSLRSPRGTQLWWAARCNLCNERVDPYVPLGARRSASFFATPGAAGDEARTHLVQKHPTHPLVG